VVESVYSRLRFVFKRLNKGV